MKEFKIVRPLTQNEINEINNYSQIEEVTIVLDNTKNQSANLIGQINPKVKVKILGGLDPAKKEKFNDIDYIERTIYNPKQVQQIIETFERYEKQINPIWNDLEKCMFIYKKLAEQMHYKFDNEPTYIDGIDTSRSLVGLVYKRAVCSGFALIFKEAMDRLGIECLYQNKCSKHSWNVVKLDGNYYPVDLTWECSKTETTGVCGFIHFGRNDKFYDDPAHNIDKEKEEQKVDIIPLTLEVLQQHLSVINTPRVIKQEMIEIVNDDGQKIWYLPFGIKGNYQEYIVSFGNDEPHAVVCESSRGDYNKLFTKKYLDFAVQYQNGYMGRDPQMLMYTRSHQLNKSNKYSRDDNSHFIVFPGVKDSAQGVNVFQLAKLQDEGQKKIILAADILSENNLLECTDESTKLLIANKLLQSDALKERVNSYNGYVGYMNLNNGEHNPQVIINEETQRNIVNLNR